MQNAIAMGALAASALGIGETSILVSSTGVIGEQLPLEKIEAAIPALTKAIRSDGVLDFARAIMTTDTEPKAVSRRVQTADGDKNGLWTTVVAAAVFLPDATAGMER